MNVADLERLLEDQVRPALEAVKASRPQTNARLASINFGLKMLLEEHRWWSLDERTFLNSLLSYTDTIVAKTALKQEQAERLMGLLERQIAHLRTGDAHQSSLGNAPVSDSDARDPQERATIGILTALPKECAAMRLMLERERRWQAQGEGGGRDYYLGEIPSPGGSPHVVAVALLPDMGNNSAAISATRLLHHFPNVRNIIMCGIAGGIPKPGDTEHDVRLGDVVVSNRNGIIQYDLVKERPDGTKEHRHPPRPPSAELLSAVRHLQTEEELGQRPWEGFLVRGARLQNKSGERPDDALDSQGNHIEYHTDRLRTPGRPRISHAPIAAANVLLKNVAHRNHLGTTFGVKAVEMEGSGVADATWTDGAGYLVVRGICDYCDEKKGDLWQGSAAVAAAAYVRALVGAMHHETIRGPKGTPSKPSLGRPASGAEPADDVAAPASPAQGPGTDQIDPKVGPVAGKEVQALAPTGKQGTSLQSQPTADIPAWMIPGAFTIGVLGLITVVSFAWNNREPSVFQWRIFQTVLSLGGAAFAMGITGLVTVNMHLGDHDHSFDGPGSASDERRQRRRATSIAITAAGALAVFVLLYFFSPAVGRSLGVEAPTPPIGQPPTHCAPHTHEGSDGKCVEDSVTIPVGLFFCAPPPPGARGRCFESDSQCRGNANVPAQGPSPCEVIAHASCFPLRDVRGGRNRFLWSCWKSADDCAAMTNYLPEGIALNGPCKTYDAWPPQAVSPAGAADAGTHAGDSGSRRVLSVTGIVSPHVHRFCPVDDRDDGLIFDKDCRATEEECSTAAKAEKIADTFPCQSITTAYCFVGKPSPPVEPGDNFMCFKDAQGCGHNNNAESGLPPLTGCKAVDFPP